MKDINVKIRTQIIMGKTNQEIAKELNVPIKRVYAQRYLLNRKAKKENKGKVRAYVRRVPKHPDQVQIVEEHNRGMRSSAKPLKPTKPSVGLDFFSKGLADKLDEAIAKNFELVEEIRRLDIVIQYLETKIARLMSK